MVALVERESLGRNVLERGKVTNCNVKCMSVRQDKAGVGERQN